MSAVDDAYMQAVVDRRLMHGRLSPSRQRSARKLSASLDVGVMTSAERLSRCSNGTSDIQSFVSELPSVCIRSDQYVALLLLVVLTVLVTG